MFPEGARTLDGELQPAQPGIGLIIAKTLAPVVPMRVFGAFEAMPRNGTKIRMKPISGEDWSAGNFHRGWTSRKARATRRVLYQKLSERVMAAIAAIEPPPTRRSM